MVRITEHFNTVVFGNPPQSLFDNARIVAEALEIVRDRIGKPIVITSGYRDPIRNKLVGGVAKSDHMHMLAVDFVVLRYFSRTLAMVAADALTAAGHEWDQLIWYTNDRHVHIGMGGQMRRQIFKGD